MTRKESTSVTYDEMLNYVRSHNQLANWRSN